MISIYMRVLLIICSVLTFFWIIRKIKTTHVLVKDMLFWFVFSVGLVVLGIVPEIAIDLAKRLGVDSPVNFVFLVIIFLLIVKVFLLSAHLSELEGKVNEVIGENAILKKKLDDSRAK